MYDSFYTRWLSMPKRELSDLGYQHAAVLVTITNANTPSLIFIKRSMSMPTHQGQVAFPGGKCEVGDKNSIDTALRETQEEIALPTHAVQVVGTLPPVYSRHAFYVTPVLGIIDPKWLNVLKADATETEHVFTVPVAFFLKHKFPMQQIAMLPGYQQVPTFECTRANELASPATNAHSSFTIWGMTAFILAEFLNHFYDAGFVLKAK